MRRIVCVLTCALIVVGGIHLAQRLYRWSVDPLQSYSPQALETALADSEVVVLVFTAEWELPSMQFERSFRQPRFGWYMRRNGVRAFEVDLTGHNPAGHRLLAQVGATNIPTAAIYDHNGTLVVHEGDTIRATDVFADIRAAIEVSPNASALPSN